MTKEIKIFMTKDFYEEVLYQFEEKADLRKLVFGYLKPLAKQGKLVKLNSSIQARVMKDGQMTMKEMDLKDIDLEITAVASDPAWIPESTGEEGQIYKQSISQGFYDDLVYFGKVFCARLKIYNDTLDPKAKDYEDKIAKFPACFEQIIQDNTINQLSNAVGTNIDKGYDEEFAQMEKSITDKEKKKNPRAKKK